MSLIDLIKAGTVNLELASALVLIASQGGSFLTAAGPGGVGKTTLMGALLAFLAPDMQITTVEGPEALKKLLRSSDGRGQCLLVHEIGSGSYFGYLWGQTVADYFSLRDLGFTLASNLHANTYEQVRAQLTGSTLQVAEEHFVGIDLIACMAREWNKRRVTTVWQSDESGRHALSWRWHSGRDDFDRISSFEETSAAPELILIRSFLSEALEEDCYLMTKLRERALSSLF